MQALWHQSQNFLAWQEMSLTQILKPLCVQDANDMCEEHPDVVILASSILSLESVVSQLPVQRLRRSTLFVDVCSVKEFPKRLMLSLLPPEVRRLCVCAWADRLLREAVLAEG